MSTLTPSPRARCLKRLRETPHSSDTDSTPPKKKLSQERSVRLGKQPDSDLGELLRYRVCDSLDHSAIVELKSRSNGDQNLMHATQKIIDKAKARVAEAIDKEGKKILQVELYLRWLEEFDFVLTALEVALDAKLPGTRRRVPGLGRISFTILYHLLEEFINEVNAHQDGWSYRYPAGPVAYDPLIMSLAEEANDPSTDTRSEDATQDAEEFLTRYDRVMAAALQRYKSESNKKLMAASIGRKEDSLGKGCCLLSEQTGFGGTDDMRFNLLTETRAAMNDWKNEFERASSPGYNTDS